MCAGTNLTLNGMCKCEHAPSRTLDQFFSLSRGARAAVPPSEHERRATIARDLNRGRQARVTAANQPPDLNRRPTGRSSAMGGGLPLVVVMVLEMTMPTRGETPLKVRGELREGDDTEPFHHHGLRLEKRAAERAVDRLFDEAV